MKKSKHNCCCFKDILFHVGLNGTACWNAAIIDSLKRTYMFPFGIFEEHIEKQYGRHAHTSH